jgi:hypothetical protein
MLEILATAHTWRGGDGAFTIVPIVGLVLTLFLIRTVLRFRIGLAPVAISAVLGALFATIGGRWGYTVTISLWVVAAGLVAAGRGAAGPFCRNGSD